MKTNWKRRGATATALSCVLFLNVAACSGTESASEAGDTTATTGEAITAALHTKMSGEAIFTGIFFGEGPVATVLPELWKNGDVTKLRERIKADPATAATRLEEQADKAAALGWSADSVARMRATATQIRNGQFDTESGPDDAGARALLMEKMRELDPNVFVRFGRGMQSGNPVLVDRALTDSAKVLQSAINGLNAPAEKNHPEIIGTPIATVVLYVAVAVATVAVSISIVWGFLVFILEPMQPDSLTRLGHDEVILRLTNSLATR